MSWDKAKRFLSDGFVEDIESGREKWEQSDQSKLLDKMREYMIFALVKADDHRGLSAGRSIEHFKAWIWLLGQDDYDAIDWGNYRSYGVPILRQICEKYGFEFPMDNKALVNMSLGKSCRETCDEGCGRG